MFEGLLPPEHDENLLTLLFHLGHWHGLAKLRIHTEATLDMMDEVTAALGQSLRQFQEKTCSAYDTRELQREAVARKKRQTKAKAGTTDETAGESHQAPSDNPNTNSSKGIGEPSHPGASSNSEESIPLDPTPPATKKRKRAKITPKAIPTDNSDPTVASSDQLARLKKSLNLNTYKNHSLGDYTNIIRKYGTTDSYSTESVCIFQVSL